MERWSQLEESLIEQVRDNPILYSCNAKSYKHMLIKQNTWKDIATNLGLTRRDCKLKWKGIRDGWRRSRIQELKGRVGRKSKYSDEKLKFLAAIRRDSHDVKEEPAEGVAAHEAIETTTPENELKKSTDANSVEKPMAQGGFEGCSETAMERHSEHNTLRLLSEELRRGREERYELMRLLSQFSLHQPSTSVDPESPTHSFFRSMADVVCQFPSHRVAELRVKVCSLVSEMEIQLMSECSPAEQLEVSLRADGEPATPPKTTTLTSRAKPTTYDDDDDGKQSITFHSSSR